MKNKLQISYFLSSFVQVIALLFLYKIVNQFWLIAIKSRYKYKPHILFYLQPNLRQCNHDIKFDGKDWCIISYLFLFQFYSMIGCKLWN